MKITSTQNDKIKELLNIIKTKDYFVLDGIKIIKEALNAKLTPICILHTGDFDDVVCDNLIEVSENILQKFTTTKTSQGVVGVFKKIKKSFKLPEKNYLVLDNLQDPGNVGTLIRSALGADFKDIYLIDCVSLTNNKLIRSTMGAIFKTNVYEISKQDFLDKFSNVKNLYACDMNGKDIYKTNFHNYMGIVVGNEGNGVSDEIMNIAANRLKIPMKNNLESLNAGVSGSIIMYYISNNNNF